MVTCPQCKAPNDRITVLHKKTEPGGAAGEGLKAITVEIKRKCARCGHSWTTHPHKNWRWVYGTRIERWVLVPPEDRDWGVWGVPQEAFKTMGKDAAMATQTGGSVLGKAPRKKAPARRW